MVLPEDSSIVPRSYKGDLFDDNFAKGDPLEHFRNWFNEAVQANTVEPDAFTLSTYAKGHVNARTVVLRGITDEGLLIYTNYDSQKAKEIESNNEVAVTFYWREIYRQVRIRGNANKVSDEQSDEYFNSRPRGSQIGAWSSRQSKKLTSRTELLEAYQEYDKTLGEHVSRPPFWGGYEIVPYEYEFFHGQPNRLHDRILFSKNNLGKFSSQRLWP